MNLLISAGEFYPSQIGGPGNTLYWIGKELVEQGIGVMAVVSDAGVAEDFAPRNKWVNLCGIQVKYCKVKSAKSSPTMIWQTIKEIKRNDIVMLSSILYKPNFFIGLVALFCGRKVIWSPRGELLIPRGRVKNTYFKILKCVFGKRVLFHATSQEEKNAIHKFLGDRAKCVVIPNYMELPHKVEAKTNDKYLLYIGRIMPVKALENLIEGVVLSQRFMSSDYKLYIAGKNEGKYYEGLLAMIAERRLGKKVFFKGLVEGVDKEYLYAGAKATLLVSQSENFGNVVIESLAQGTPAVTSLGTPWQSLPENGVGYWIDNSPSSIAESVDNLLSLPDKEYLQMRQRCYEFCEKEFDISTNIGKWVETINNM